MKKIINIKDLNNVNKSIIEKIAGYLLSEKVIILPTKTVYGISCIYNSKKAIDRIYKIKKRLKSLPFIILISNFSSLKGLVLNINQKAEALIDYYWKGDISSSLTLVFKKNRKLNSYITSGSKKIAIRRAELKFLRNIIDLSGPIISTSATISGKKKTPVNILDIEEDIKEKVDLIVDTQAGLSGVESTILDISEKPRLIRQGQVKYEQILSILEKL